MYMRFFHNQKIALKQIPQNLPNLAEIDENRAKIALFCLEIKINLYLKPEIWQNQLFKTVTYYLHYGS